MQQDKWNKEKYILHFLVLEFYIYKKKIIYCILWLICLNQNNNMQNNIYQIIFKKYKKKKKINKGV